ncbi:MAG: acyl-CoA thioesterase [Desulfamplus sp.]|nr:acyl-CoA thioesterase [Desulfamplus sp.]MBF0259564.1 acyl-CoA thioesterase [Desulfamplus sp.]
MNSKSRQTHPLQAQASQFLETCAAVIEMPLPWSDMNAAQHISNTAYFRYFETARVHFFEQVDFVQHDEQRDIGIVLASICCKFKIPLVYPDTLSIGTKVVSMQADRFTMQHIVVSHKHQKVAAQGEAVIVTYDYKKLCKASVPQFLINRIETLQNSRTLSFSTDSRSNADTGIQNIVKTDTKGLL